MDEIYSNGSIDDVLNKILFNPITLRMAKTLWSFGHFECNGVNK